MNINSADSNFVKLVVGSPPFETVELEKMSFDGKVILVTGASSGIGAEIARYLAKLGGKVAIVGRNEERLSEVAAQIESIRPSSSLAIIADVVKDTERIINETIKHFGQLDVLVNNAGVVTQDTVGTYKDDEFDRIFNTNVRSVIKLTQLAVPYLEKTSGNIVNVSSIAGLRPVKNVLSYCISKSALDQFTKCTALDLAEKRIRVNSVNPALVDTPILQTAGIPKEAMDDILTQTAAKYPIGRVGHVTDVSQAVAYLAGDSGSFLTGVLLPIDGGCLIGSQ